MPEILGSFMGSPEERWNGEAEILPLLQYAVQVAVVIGPQRDARVRVYPLRLLQKQPAECGRGGGKQQPVRAVHPRVVVIIVVDFTQLQGKRSRGLPHYRDEIEVAVGDMHGEHPAGPDLPQVGSKRLDREKVHRNGVAREGVEREHVEILRSLALERKARVAELHLDLRRAVLEEAELGARKLDHLGIDVVETNDVAGPPICS